VARPLGLATSNHSSSSASAACFCFVFPVLPFAIWSACPPAQSPPDCRRTSRLRNPCCTPSTDLLSRTGRRSGASASRSCGTLSGAPGAPRRSSRRRRGGRGGRGSYGVRPLRCASRCGRGAISGTLWLASGPCPAFRGWWRITMCLRWSRSA
jgi:hypothetical protein